MVCHHSDKIQKSLARGLFRSALLQGFQGVSSIQSSHGIQASFALLVIVMEATSDTSIGLSNSCGPLKAIIDSELPLNVSKLAVLVVTLALSCFSKGYPMSFWDLSQGLPQSAISFAELHCLRKASLQFY